MNHPQAIMIANLKQQVNADMKKEYELNEEEVHEKHENKLISDSKLGIMEARHYGIGHTSPRL